MLLKGIEEEFTKWRVTVLMDWNNGGPRITNTQRAHTVVKEQIVKNLKIFCQPEHHEDSEKANSDCEENICNTRLTKN